MNNVRDLEQRIRALNGMVASLRGEAARRRDIEEILRKRTQELDERIKELDCLYNISNLVKKRNISVEEILRAAVDIIPSAWQYPEITCARIVFRKKTYQTPRFRLTAWKMSSPIRVSGARAGTVDVCYFEEMPPGDEGPFVKEERRLIDGIAEQLALLIERVQAEEALRESERRLHALSQKTISAQEEDRARLSRELHDGLGHQLAVIGLELDWFRKHDPERLTDDHTKALRELLSNATAELRRLCKGLRPMIPDYLGLELALETLAHDFQTHSGLAVELDFSPVRNGAFQPDMAINIYRILQEALTNVARHSGARRVTIRFGPRAGRLKLEVRDDGAGMPDTNQAETRGLGITGMRERAALCGGGLELISHPGGGTRVILRVPLHDATQS